MRLKNQGDAFDGGGVGAFAALGEALLDDWVGVGEKRDAFAGFAFAAEVVFQAFAIGGLREHPGQSEFAYTPRAGEEKGMRDAASAQRATKSRHDFGVAEEAGKVASVTGCQIIITEELDGLTVQLPAATRNLLFW